ncbi:type II toxin-antitoxin system RelE/ParE family toxin [bacterium]|nr:type II toxin-antitoxin system RelE/ParE family toxin [bacterium]MBU1958259.1 type II toxin-antitoxin system RelE/ParE family toxin [bacterium]
MIFIESKIFEKLREKYFDDESYKSFQNFLLEQPLAGDVIQGTGGLRKIRWTANGKGKRSGTCTIYLYLVEKSHIHFLTVYAKNEMSDLTPNEKKILKSIVEEIKNA